MMLHSCRTEGGWLEEGFAGTTYLFLAASLYHMAALNACNNELCIVSPESCFLLSFTGVRFMGTFSLLIFLFLSHAVLLKRIFSDPAGSDLCFTNKLAQTRKVMFGHECKSFAFSPHTP